MLLLNGVATVAPTGIVFSAYLRTRTVDLCSVGSSADEFDMMIFTRIGFTTLKMADYGFGLFKTVASE